MDEIAVSAQNYLDRAYKAAYQERFNQVYSEGIASSEDDEEADLDQIADDADEAAKEYAMDVANDAASEHRKHVAHYVL